MKGLYDEWTFGGMQCDMLETGEAKTSAFIVLRHLHIAWLAMKTPMQGCHVGRG